MMIRITRKDGNCEALQLEGRTTSRQSFWAVLGNYVLCMHINCYLATYDHNSHIAIIQAFSDKDFLEKSNNLAIRRRSRCNLDLLI